MIFYSAQRICLMCNSKERKWKVSKWRGMGWFLCPACGVYWRIKL